MNWIPRSVTWAWKQDSTSTGPSDETLALANTDCSLGNPTTALGIKAMSRLLTQEVTRLNNVYYFNLPNLGVICTNRGFPGGASGKEPTYQWRRLKRQGFDPWVRKISWRRAWQTTPVFLSRESHVQRSLVGYTVHGVAKSRRWLKQLSMHRVS